MKTMFMDTSTQALIICFLDDREIIYHQELIGNNNHSDNLLKKIQEGLVQTNLEVKDFDRIVVGIGPGLYTGLRVSLTVAKMFSWTVNIPLYTISSLKLIACGYFNEMGNIIIKTHAKKNYVYCTVINIKQKITTIIEDKFITIQEFNDIIDKYEDATIVDETNYKFDPLYIKDYLLTQVEDINLLEPNYLRGEL